MTFVMSLLFLNSPTHEAYGSLPREVYSIIFVPFLLDILNKKYEKVDLGTKKKSIVAMTMRLAILFSFDIFSPN